MNALLIPESRDRLIKRWAAVLKFRIGNGGLACLDQLPNGEDFPKEYPADDHILSAYALRKVLGVAFLKLIRPWPAAPGVHDEIAADGGWLLDAQTCDYQFAGGTPHLAPLGCALEMALRAPDRLSVLIARIDALNNSTLHEMAMLAIRCMPVPDVFDGLLLDDLVEGVDD